MRARDDDFIRDIRHLQETMERLLSDFSRLRMPLLLSKESVWHPLTDVYETDKEFVIRMEIPGMDPADFNVTLPGDMKIRVWDSTAETRFMVVPARPQGTEDWNEEELAKLVTRDSMIGTGLPRQPEEVA